MRTFVLKHDLVTSGERLQSDGGIFLHSANVLHHASVLLLSLWQGPIQCTTTPHHRPLEPGTVPRQAVHQQRIGTNWGCGSIARPAAGVAGVAAGWQQRQQPAWGQVAWRLAKLHCPVCWLLLLAAQWVGIMVRSARAVLPLHVPLAHEQPVDSAKSARWYHI
jgi:hypothetical protein